MSELSSDGEIDQIDHDDTSHPCNKCVKIFKTKHELKQHKKKVHQGEVSITHPVTKGTP